MKVLVLGGNGLVGSSFVDLLTNSGIEHLSPTRLDLDILNKCQLERYFSKNNKISYIVNFAAYTDVSAAENDRNNLRGSTWNLNVNSIKYLVELAKQHNFRLIQISTDMVFPGKVFYPGPYSEDSQVVYDSNVLSWYGWSKAVAEKIIVDNLTNYSIVRISNPVRFGYKRKADYIAKILKTFRNNQKSSFFADQFLTLTFIDDVSEVVAKIIKLDLVGVFHVSSDDIFTPFSIAKYLAKKIYYHQQISKSSLTDFFSLNPKLENRYMQYSGLLCQRTEKMLNINFSSWKKIVDTLIQQGLQ